ncbi:hypothetical protein WMY93_015504 [Mugilogobius chulae]|uniref:Uncharacterized protein n=1 Tax=Mugilogobius chulae TaxID=88201 RepID=A0AAW0NSY1_9GOBI
MIYVHRADVAFWSWDMLIKMPECQQLEPQREGCFKWTSSDIYLTKEVPLKSLGEWREEKLIGHVYGLQRFSFELAGSLGGQGFSFYSRERKSLPPLYLMKHLLSCFGTDVTLWVSVGHTGLSAPPDSHRHYHSTLARPRMGNERWTNAAAPGKVKTYTTASCHLLWMARADPRRPRCRGDSAVLAEPMTFGRGESVLGRLKVDWLTEQSRRAPDVRPRW